MRGARRARPSLWVGLSDMSASENPCALRLAGNDIELWQAGRETRQVDGEVLAGMRSVPLAVPADRVRLTELSVQADERRHLNQSIPYMLEEEVIEPVEALHFAYSAIKNDSCIAAIASRQDMEQWLAQLGSDFEGPFVHEALLLPWQPGEICLLVEGPSVLIRFSEWQGARIERELLGTLLEVLPEPPEVVIVYGDQQAEDVELLPPSLRQVAQWRQGDFSAALMVAAPNMQVLDLRQGRYAPRLPFARWWQAWKVVVIALFVGLSVQVASDVTQYFKLRDENQALRMAIQESYRSANPRGAIVDAEKQLDRQIAEYARGEAGTAFTPFLDQVTRVIADVGEISLSNINFTASAGEMRIDLVAPNYEQVESLRQRLADDNLATTLETSSLREGRVRARLRVEA